MPFFPAVMIGGPPDSGKSVLTYHLSQQLRRQGVQHYVLRANPDGEGDWAGESDRQLVRTILIPRAWSPAFVDHVCQSLTRRHLPLLVDAGGRPTDWQEIIFDHCSHAILLTPDEASRAEWQLRAGRHNLRLLADLHSSLHEPDRLLATQPYLTGTISGLVWGSQLNSPTFDRLLEQVAQLFACDAAQLRHAHLSAAPVEHAIDLDRLAQTLKVGHKGHKAVWQPNHLPRLLDYLPPGKALGLYGRAPNWLYAAAALHIYPAPFYQFDACLGWISPPQLQFDRPAATALLQCRQERQGRLVEFTFTLNQTYLDYADSDNLSIPPAVPDTGLVLNGKLPHWLITALALAYRDAPVLAVYQPQAGRVVVQSRLPDYRPGDLLA